MSEPTKAAVKAADMAITHISTSMVYSDTSVAEIIDRETGLPELIAALKQCILTISQVRADLSESGKWEELDHAESVIEVGNDALRKAGAL